MVNIQTQQLNVELSNLADEFVIADAVNIELLQETPHLDVLVDQQSINEGESARFLVSRTGSLTQPTTVLLSVDDPARATVPLGVTIPAGQSSAAFDLNSVDDSIGAITPTINVTAFGIGLASGTAAIDIVDNDPAAVIIDNGDSGYTSVKMTTATGQGFEDDVQFASAQSGATATWSFTGLTAGRYRVFATWSEQSNRATDAPFSVYDGNVDPNSLLSTVDVNQQLAPDDLFLDTAVFEQLGEFSIFGNTLSVQLTTDADDGCAHEIWVMRLRSPSICSNCCCTSCNTLLPFG